MQRDTTRNPGLGFTFIEIMIVVGIIVIVSAIGLPRMTTAIANMKLRSSMTSVSSFLQNVRMLAIKNNRTTTAKHYNREQAPRSLVFYAKDATDGGGPVTTDSQIEMEAPINPYDAPMGPGAPPAISNSAMGLLAAPQTGDPSFNSRGLPCAYSTGACPNVAFIKYFKDDRISGNGGWAAISISPAGRIKRWFWNGSSWID